MSTDSLRSNKLRAGLTVLGVVIGISSVIALNSIGQGVQKATEGLLQALGTDVMLVLAGPARVGLVSQGAGSASTLTLADARALESQAPAIDGVAAFLRGAVQLVYEDKNILTAAMGTEANFPQVRTWQVQEGRFFSQEEVDELARVAVLGYKTRDALFGNVPSVVGERIRVQGERFTVIGVMEPKGGLGSADPDDQIYVPLTTMSARLVGNNAVSGLALTGFWAKSVSQDQVDAAQFQLTNLLRLRHNILPGQEDDFSLTNQVDIQQTLNIVVSLFTVMVVAIGSISLVVGGIGIANIMLVTVVERTREIGIRKALGASEVAILYQFLTEAVVVSVMGGAIGIVLGVGVAAGTAFLLRIPLIVSGSSVVVSFSLSLLVGLLAGVIPARSASKMDPIVALRVD
ncbi:MAG: ABC transporter permease [Cyanobacteriota bacterium]|nr:ABC transporter permease [Cyanobacteriota bacterium]